VRKLKRADYLQLDWVASSGMPIPVELAHENAQSRGEQVKTKEIIERSQRYPEVDEAQRQQPAVAKKELTAKDNL